MPMTYGSTFRRAGSRAVFIITLLLLAVFDARSPAAAQGIPADAAQVRAHAREILNQPEFQPESPDSPMAQLGRAFREKWENTSRWATERWNAFRKWFRGLFPVLGGAGSAVSSIISIVFVALFIGLAGWLVAWLIRSLMLQRRLTQAQARSAYDMEEADEEVPLEPNAWLQQAQGYAGSDDYRRAFRAVFVAILLSLHEDGLIEFDRSRTNGDYLKLLRRKNVRPLYDILDPLVIEFDRRWYGRAETGLEDYERIQQTFKRVRSLTSEGAAASAPAAAAGKA